MEIVYTGEHGPTVQVAHVKMEAYKYASYIVNGLGRRYRMTCHEDGAITVAGDGLAPLTFEVAS